MSFTGTTASLQKRTEEAIRYALDYTLGYKGDVFESVVSSLTISFVNPDNLSQTLSIGDVILIGSQQRAVTSFEVDQEGVEVVCIVGISSVITATAGDVVRLDYSENVRRSDDMRSRENVPWLCFVQCINLKQDDPGSTYYTGNLVVSLHSLFNTIESTDGDAVTDASLITDLAPHEAKVTTITGILNDPPTLWDLVKPGATNRPISDLGIVAILNAEEPGSVSEGGLHNFEIRKTIRLINSD